MGIRWLSDLAGTLRDFTVKGFLYVTGKYMTASGTNTYTASPAVTLGAYTTGLEITVKFTNANTGASTLNVSSLGAKTIQINGTAVTSGQIAAGGTYVLVYDGTNFQLLGAGGGGGGISTIWNEGGAAVANGGTANIDWSTYNSYVLTVPVNSSFEPTVTVTFTDPPAARLLHLTIHQQVTFTGANSTSLAGSTLPTLLFSGGSAYTYPASMASGENLSMLLWFDGSSYFVQSIYQDEYPYGVAPYSSAGHGAGLVPATTAHGLVLGSDGWTDPANVSVLVSQASHGFSVGNVLKRSGSAYALAQADSAANAEVMGIVSVVVDANSFRLLSHGRVTGLSGLTDGVVYFLSDSSAGALTATEPTTTGHVSKPLLVAYSTTAGWFYNFRGEVLAAVVSPFTKGTTTVNFGSGATDAKTSVTQSGTWTVAQAWIEPAATSNNTADNHVAENLECYAKDIVAGTSFNVYVKCTQGNANGQYNVAWLVI